MLAGMADKRQTLGFVGTVLNSCRQGLETHLLMELRGVKGAIPLPCTTTKVVTLSLFNLLEVNYGNNNNQLPIVP
jgi:hypothetical protein